MNRQMYGVALFVVIVGFSVFTYESLSYLISAEPAQPKRHKCDRGKSDSFKDNLGRFAVQDSDISVKLENVVADMGDETVKARLNFGWVEPLKAPKTVSVQMEFHNFDGSHADWISEPVSIDQASWKGKTGPVEVSFDCPNCDNLPRNLYATVKVWSKANSEKKLLYEVTQMKPVLVQE